jgi:hypothetical protein
MIQKMIAGKRKLFFMILHLLSFFGEEVRKRN